MLIYTLYVGSDVVCFIVGCGVVDIDDEWHHRVGKVKKKNRRMKQRST